MPRDIVSRVCPIQRDVVRERHVAHAKFVIGAQRTQGILDGVSAFHAQQRADSAPCIRGAYVGGGERRHEHVGITRNHALRNIDLFQLNARVAGIAHLPRDVHRPELPANHAFAQPGDVGHACRGGAQIIRHNIQGILGRLAHGPWQIIVSIYQRRIAQQFLHVCHAHIKRRVFHRHRGSGRLWCNRLCRYQGGYHHRQPATQHQPPHTRVQHPSRSK